MAASNLAKSVQIYELGEYDIMQKDPAPEEARDDQSKYHALREGYAKSGMRRSVNAVMLANHKGFPHVLLLKKKPIPNQTKAYCKLPDGQLEPGESEEAGINRIMNRWFSRVPEPREWPVVDIVSQWWRPKFDNLQFPYCPIHCTKPVELTTSFLVKVPAKRELFVPSNYEIIAVPLWMIFDDANEYGPQISALPLLLGRFNIAMDAPDAAAE